MLILAQSNHLCAHSFVFRGMFMSLRNRIVLPVILSALAILAACGGSSSSTPTPPPSGGFTNSNFNGTYTFSFAGSDINRAIFTVSGSLVACGCTGGTISSGTVDFVDPLNLDTAMAIGSNSTYHISSDGRGTAKLMVPSGGFSTEIDVDFVLSSSSHGLIMEFDANAGGSGTIDLQPAAVTQSSLATTPFAFSISGGDNNSNPLATVGALTLDANGNITTGVEDFNYNTTPTPQQGVTGSVTVGSGTTPGVAQINSLFGNFTFDVYAIDSTHLKLIESDGQAVMVGDAFAQTNTAFPTGTLVFQMGGLDFSSFNLITTAGLMSSSGGTISSGAQDINDGGVIDNGTTTPFSFTGIESSSGGGRYLVTLSGFAGASQFAAYPSSGGLFLLQVDSGVGAGVMGGVALTQQSTTGIAASQGYGMSLSGEDVANGIQLDEIAEFKTNGTTTTGLVDDDETGSTSNFNGSYTAGSNGTGAATFNSGVQQIFYYGVDDSTIFFISADPSQDQATMGTLQTQTTPTSAAFAVAKAPRALPTPRAFSHKRNAQQRRGGHRINTFE